MTELDKAAVDGAIDASFDIIQMGYNIWSATSRYYFAIILAVCVISIFLFISFFIVFIGRKLRSSMGN